jgi:uncharacterized protein
MSLSKLCAAILSGSLLCTTLCAQDTNKPDPPKETTVVATGSARVERAPDYVDVMVGCVALDKTAGAAHAAATKAMDAAITAIKGLKLEGEELQTGSVDLMPRYERRDRSNEDEPPRIIGYSASITLRVRTGDLKSVARVIDAALAAGCNRVDYVQFGIKEAIAAREEAVKLATQAAKRKAVVMAEALELRLTRVVQATTSSQQGWYGGNRISQMANAAMDAPAQGGSADAVVPGKIEVWADATVTFGAEGRQ